MNRGGTRGWIRALAGLALGMSVAATAQMPVSGPYADASGQAAVELQPAGDALYLIIGDRITGYHRQGEGLYHYYDAEADVTYALRVLDEETVEWFKPYAEPEDSRVLRRVHPQLAPPPAPAESPMTDAAGAADAALSSVPPAAADAPPPSAGETADAPGADDASGSAAAASTGHPQLKLSTGTPLLEGAVAGSPRDADARLLALACEAAAAARAQLTPARYADYRAQLQTVMAPFLAEGQPVPCEALETAPPAGE